MLTTDFHMKNCHFRYIQTLDSVQPQNIDLLILSCLFPYEAERSAHNKSLNT